MSQRYYRTEVSGRLTQFGVRYFESDVLIRARRDLTPQAEEAVRRAHGQIRAYCERFPEFRATLTPLAVDERAAPVVRAMMRAGKAAGVGPMAAVAGAVADVVGRRLQRYSRDVIVENGGDIFLAVSRVCRVGLFAGPASVFNRLAIRIAPSQTPCGICTSSATMGHSLSFGKTQATVVMARSAALADALATSFGNIVQSDEDIELALTRARRMRAVRGIIIVMRDKVASYGNIAWEILDK